MKNHDWDIRARVAGHTRFFVVTATTRRAAERAVIENNKGAVITFAARIEG